MPIHQEVSFVATPKRVYHLLTDSAEFDIQGRQIELVPDKHIVQTWRGIDWAPGDHSIVRFTLTPEGNGTRLLVDHDAYPERPSPMYPSWREHLSTNWPVFYFEPLAKYLAA